MKKELAYLFTGLILKKEVEEELIQRLSNEFGEVIIKSELIPFDFTDYYRKEMGEGLSREWILFKDLIKQAMIADIKHKTIKIENEFSTKDKGKTYSDKSLESVEGLCRMVNIDPGYVTLSKVVLATTKDCAHRIYLKDDIFAEVTLIYHKGEWHHLKWTYMDYRTDAAISFFGQCREYILTGKTGEVGSK